MLGLVPHSGKGILGLISPSNKILLGNTLALFIPIPYNGARKMNKTLSKNLGSVLVTGGGGFVGANLVRRLLALGYKTHLIWKKSTNPWRLRDILPNIILNEVDLLDRNKLKRTLEVVNPIAIFHLAAHGAYSSQTDVDQMIDVNIHGTLNLLLASQDIPYKVFINTGSSSEYGFKKTPMREIDLLEPTSFYASTKASGTLLSQVFASEFQKPILTVRPFSVYGPYEESSRFIPTVMMSLMNKKPIQLTTGAIRRDFIYIDDFIDVYIKLMEQGSRFTGEILNVGSGKQYTNDEVVETLFKVTDKTAPIKKGAFVARKWDTDTWVADTSHIKKLLDWEAQYSLSKGLLETYRWFQKNKGLYK